jgi:hypothetical protein
MFASYTPERRNLPSICNSDILVDKVEDNTNSVFDGVRGVEIVQHPIVPWVVYGGPTRLHESQTACRPSDAAQAASERIAVVGDVFDTRYNRFEHRVLLHSIGCTSRRC